MKSLDPIESLEVAEDAASQRAADFFERRRFWEWSNADQAELDAWLAESILHHAAFLRVEAIAARADRLAALNLLELKQVSSRNERRAAYRGFIVPLLAAASIALIMTLGYPYLISWLQPPDRAFSTDVGDHTLLKFADGTEIELNTDSTIHYRMTTAERTVWLDRGEAWFHIAHNAANPFAVIVGKHRVVDLGTEFLVRRGSDKIEVALVSGRAALSAEGTQTATQTAMLKPGDDAIATPLLISVTRKTPQELADELAWRRGVLVFRKTKLTDVVREFNRYNTTKLVIADPSIADVEITAEIKTDHYNDLLSLVHDVLNLHADREGNSILISRGTRERAKKAASVNHSL